MRQSTAKIRGLVDGKGLRIKPMTAAELKRTACNAKAQQRAAAKFESIDRLNGMIDAGIKGASAAKRAMIDRDTDGRSRHEREAKLAGSELWNPTGKRHARGRDDTQWINRKNAGKAGKYAGR